MTYEQTNFYNSSVEYFATLSQQNNDYFLPYSDYVSLYIKPSEKLLDLGCGTGQSTDLLRKTGVEIIGVDGCEKYIIKAKINFPNNQYCFAQAESLPFPDNTFDCVASYNTFEHLSDVSKVLGEIARVLKPGGFLIIHSPNLLSINHPLNAIRLFKGMTFEGKKSFIQLISMALNNTRRLLFRRLSGQANIIKRKNFHDYFFPDSDATWLMNPLDMRALLLKYNFSIIHYQNTDSLKQASFFKKFVSLIAPEQMGIIRIVAQIKKE